MDHHDLVALPPPFCELLTPEDLQLNATLHSFEAIAEQLAILDRSRDAIDTILDVGCKAGGFTAALGTRLEASRVYGIEVDVDLAQRARTRGVDVVLTDVDRSPLPFPDGSIDLVLAFGLLEHLRYYDLLFDEIGRVLADGWCWVTTPNLAGWINRMAVATGHQPRNVEISSRRTVGTLPWYPDEEFLDHVHAPTYRALVDLLVDHGFEIRDSTGLAPYQGSRLVAAVDAIVGWRPGLARRVSVLAHQTNA